VPAFDHGIVTGANLKPLPRVQDVVVQIVFSRQPDRAFNHREQAGLRAQLARLTRRQNRPMGRCRGHRDVRIHHQSPFEQGCIMLHMFDVVQ
jgi:hypothetical protein